MKDGWERNRSHLATVFWCLSSLYWKFLHEFLAFFQLLVLSVFLIQIQVLISKWLVCPLGSCIKVLSDLSQQKFPLDFDRVGFSPRNIKWIAKTCSSHFRRGGSCGGSELPSSEITEKGLARGFPALHSDTRYFPGSLRISVQACPKKFESSQSNNFSFYSKLQKEYCFSLHSFSPSNLQILCPGKKSWTATPAQRVISELPGGLGKKPCHRANLYNQKRGL